MLGLVQRFRFEVVREPLARVHAGGLRSATNFAEGAEFFLAKHDREFARLGAGHRRIVRGKHFENVAANAYANREYKLGSRYLLKSFAANFAQNPIRLGALLLAPFDAFFGTSFLMRAALWNRQCARSS